MSTDGPEGGGPPELTAAECVRAGMYWFGRNDLAAAEAWWQRALYLDPANVRAQECLRLLAKSTGRPEEVPSKTPPPIMPSPPVAAPLRAPSVPSVSQVPIARAPSKPSASELERRLFSDEPRGGDLDVDVAAWALGQAQSTSSADPLEFATDIPEDTGDIIRVDSGTPVPDLERTPWDDGPARTSVVTVSSSAEHDALAEHTPLPDIDRERFFGRGGEGDDPDLVGVFDQNDEASFEDVLDERSDPRPSAVRPSEPEIRIDEPIEAPRAQERTAAAASPDVLMEQARDFFALHDFNGAIEILEKLVELAPNHTEGRALLAQCRSQLVRMLESKLGDLDRIPRLMISSEEVIWLNLNHRAGFILSQIDGTVTYDDIIALSGMPRLDTLKIMVELLNNRVIG